MQSIKTIELLPSFISLQQLERDKLVFECQGETYVMIHNVSINQFLDTLKLKHQYRKDYPILKHIIQLKLLELDFSYLQVLYYQSFSFELNKNVQVVIFARIVKRKKLTLNERTQVLARQKKSSYNPYIMILLAFVIYFIFMLLGKK